jgi:Asp/Glu/hydantoin racemase
MSENDAMIESRVTSERRAAAFADRPTLGLLMLDTAFPRPPGDVAHPETFSFPVIRKVVRGASVEAIVRQGGGGALEAFRAAARALVAEGARGILTSCGFLTLHQRDIAQACRAPVAASALLQVAPVERMLPSGRRCGVVTFESRSLTPAHLLAAGAAADTPLSGVEGGHLHAVISHDLPELDQAQAEREVVAAAARLMERGDVGALVLECANMGPYARAVARVCGVPVYDVVTLGEQFAAALAPRGWRR